MDLRIFIEPQQGASYEAVVALARLAEELGFDGFFSSDHYLKMGDASGLPGPLDAWTTLAGLARDTTRLRLGTLVTPITFRQPGPLAILVAQVDAMSGGRVELGLGTGWFDDEHHAYGIPFPPLGERFERLEEQLAIITGLWTTPVGETFDFNGTHYQLTGSPAMANPLQQPHPPVIIGGGGPKRTPRLVATYADEFNAMFVRPDDVPATEQRIDEACAARDRDPATVLRSVSTTLCLGADEAEVARRAATMGRQVDELRASSVCGTPAEVVDRLGQYTDAGLTRAYLQVLDLTDHDHLHLLAEQVLPHV